MTTYSAKYTTLKKQAVFCLFTALCFSCTKKYAEYNTNPYQATIEQQQADNYLIGGKLPVMINAVTPAGDPPGGGTNYVNAYQVAVNLSSDCYSGFMGQAGDWAGNNNNLTYAFIPSWNNVQFSLLGTLMREWNNISQYATEVNDSLLLSVANVIKAIGVIRTTDSFGPIPYSDIPTGTATPAFDSQESIYYALLDELKTARDKLYADGAAAGTPLQKFDLVYAGDYTKWAKLANSLILRLAMRTVYANEATAKQYAEEAAANPAGLLTAVTDGALHSIKSGNGSFNYSNPLVTLTDNYNEARAGASIVSVLRGYKDPRLDVYFEKSQLSGNTDKVVGIRSGSIITRSLYQPFSKLNVSYTTPMPWMQASEVYFLRAEGAIRGWNMGGTAQDFYEMGVKAAFAESGATMPAGYLDDDASVPEKYTDPANGSGGEMDYDDPQSQSITGVNKWTIKWSEAANFETKLHRIIMQKWIALYMNGPEGWAEYRRTGYPRILPIVSNKGAGVSTNFQVRRLPYPTDQYVRNGAAVNKAVGLLGGADNGGTRLWWDKKSNIPYQ